MLITPIFAPIFSTQASGPDSEKDLWGATCDGCLFEYQWNIFSLNITASIIDNPQVDLEFDRHPVLEGFCAEGKEENWEDLFVDLPAEYVKDINSYAKDNLIKLRVFISTPFATEYTRSIETTRTSFIANIGGKSDTCFCIGTTSSINVRFNGFVHGVQLRQRCGDDLLPRCISSQPLQDKLRQPKGQWESLGSKKEGRRLNTSIFIVNKLTICTYKLKWNPKD